MRAKHDKWIKELTEAGYFVCEPHLSGGPVIYADRGPIKVHMQEDGSLWLDNPDGSAIALAGVTWYR